MKPRSVLVFNVIYCYPEIKLFKSKKYIVVIDLLSTIKIAWVKVGVDRNWSKL